MSASTIKVTVHDLVVTKREVEIPSVCPDCGADFKDKPLTVWEWQDQYRSATPDAEAQDDIDWGAPYQGEGYMHISWTCGCGHVLAESKETRS